MCRSFSKTLPTLGKALSLSCSAHGSCTPVAGAQSVLSPGLGLALLAEGSFFGWQEQKGHQNRGEESGPGSGSFLQRQRWGGTNLGSFGAPSKALMKLYPEGNWCQVSGHSVGTAVPSPGCRDLSSTLVPSLQSTPGPHSQLPVLHHPAADGFPQALMTHLVSPRTCRSPVTI